MSDTVELLSDVTCGRILVTYRCHYCNGEFSVSYQSGSPNTRVVRCKCGQWLTVTCPVVGISCSRAELVNPDGTVREFEAWSPVVTKEVVDE